MKKKSSKRKLAMPFGHGIGQETGVPSILNPNGDAILMMTGKITSDARRL
jgi:hypothetical protein